ncbi:hypothetical protein MYCTH_2311792 [Thermothelomyces thermophilus ATCC 42464]|uniref:Adhesin domain-containing protein n=1 Tax=Thermothelomyces thermophilus (strain ATCC 42464 / BCRC 31852 / DSM 1799) TaxID=573729 RepID=G2QPN0_THET4|nr:uncharacterized protein MYCTH_2311792 [Thermothelomyces thermophilus ATCC 42464]AEO61543.1 hypothetical protein MYCTH_2311792 [Thermothelomyces thermophilus ATCC 42464]
MPYSDDLYASLEEEEAHIELIGETLTQDGIQGFDLTSEHVRPDTSTTDAVVASVDHDTGVAGEEEDPHVFSPTDGYFGTAPGASSGTLAPASSNVPHVPNVLVEDPSLQRDDAEGKAAEAARERLRNDREAPGSDDGDASASASHTPAPSHNGVSSASAVTPTPTSHSAATYYAPSSSSRFPGVATLTSYTTFSTQRRSAYPSEHFPFIPNEAPPAYSPSPPVPSNTQQRFEGYRTVTQTRDAAIINMGRPEETQGLLARQPESMRDHNAHDVEEMSPTWWTRMRRAREHASWRSCKFVLIALVLFVVTAGFLTSIITGPPGRTGSDNPASDEPQTDPGQPNMSYPDVDGDFAWDSTSFCKDAKIHRRVQTFVANLGADKQLTLLERTVDEDGRRGWGEVHVQGAVVFRRAGPDTPQSAVTLEVAVTDERLDVTSSWDAEAGTLEVLVPHRVEWSKDRPRACVNVKVTAWIPENSKLEHLNTDVVHLDIKLLDNLSLTVEKGTALTSTVGTITSASSGTAARDDKLVDTTNPPPSYDFHSRIIDVHTTAAPITGVWPLYDYLGLHSTAGNVRVAINPKEADADFPKPAILYVKTLSGDVKVREPIHAAQATFHIAQHTFSAGSADRRRAEAQAEAYLPPREYRVDVHTSSGDIDAAVAFGLSGGFKSTSGTVSLELLPVLDATQAEPGARTVELSTASTSGATDVKVLEPLWVDSFPAAAATQGDGGGSSGKPRYVDLSRPSSSPSSSSARRTGGAKDEDDGDSAPPPLRCLHSTHMTTTANIKLRYPASWEGDISLGTLTGSLQVGGDGVKLIKAGSDWPGINKFLLARKGEKGEGGRLTAKSTSGDANVWIGGESAALSTERM